MKKRRKLGKRLLQPDFQKIAKGLTAPGEAGRAIPGATQAAEQRKTVRVYGEPQVPQATGRLEMSTFFTRAGGDQLLYQAERWVRVRLILETAGPVAVGTRENVAPVLSGKGITLVPNEELTFEMNKGDRLYIAAGSVNRVRLITQPIAWGEQVAQMLGTLITLLKGR